MVLGIKINKTRRPKNGTSSENPSSVIEQKDQKKKPDRRRNDGSREQPQSTAPMSEKKSLKQHAKGSSKPTKKKSRNPHNTSVDDHESANQMLLRCAGNHDKQPTETLQTPTNHQNNVKTSREDQKTMKSPTCVKVPAANSKDGGIVDTISKKIKRSSKMGSVTSPSHVAERSQKVKVNIHAPNSTLTPNSTLSTTDKWLGEDTAKNWMEKVEFEKMKTEFEKLQTMTVKVEKECKKWKENGKLNQSTDDYPALDSNLATFENVYVNMSLVHIPLQRDIYIGQIPVKGNEEAFWKVVFDKKITFMYIIAEQDSIDLFPKRSGDHAYHGTMFVNNRRVEIAGEDVHRFLIEVLPEGCSNSIICNITVIKNWNYESVYAKQAVVIKDINEMINFLEITKDETALIVSKHGAGRAGYFAALSVSIYLMNKGSEPSIYDIVKSLRSQRPKSVESLTQYASLYTSLFYYIKKKLAKADGHKKIVSPSKEAISQKAIQLTSQFTKALLAEADAAGGKSTMTMLK